jgi:hypothetical protein
LIDQSLAHPGVASTVRVDPALLEEISELTGIEYWALSSAFVGEEKNLALDIMKTIVTENITDTSQDWQRHVLAWAKENSSGVYRPGYWDGYDLTYEHNEYLRSIGRL